MRRREIGTGSILVSCANSVRLQTRRVHNARAQQRGPIPTRFVALAEGPEHELAFPLERAMPTQDQIVFLWKPHSPINRAAWETVARAFLEDPGRAPGGFDVHLTARGAAWVVRVVHLPVQIGRLPSAEPREYSAWLVRKFVQAGLSALL